MTAERTDPNDETGSGPGGQRTTKVARVIDEYGLAGMAEELERRWTADGGERASLRELAGEINQRVLRAALEGRGQAPLDGEAENLYRLLVDDDVSSGARTRAEARLEREGIDIRELRRDFVSHQAVHTYLTEVRGVSLPARTTRDGETVEDRGEAIQRLASRLVAVAEKALRDLRNAGHITLGAFDVFVTVHVYCDDCDSRYEIGELLEGRGCACESRPG